MVVIKAIFLAKCLDDFFLFFFLLLKPAVLTLCAHFDDLGQLVDILCQIVFILRFILKQILEYGPLELPEAHAGGADRLLSP